MNKITKIALLVTLALFSLIRTYAWGKEGHNMVVQVAFHFLDSTTQEKIKRYLGKLSIEEASTWMDDMRSNDFYSYMRTWHYIDVEKGKDYQPQATDKNAVIILNAVIEDLKASLGSTKKRDVKVGMYVLFHLIGDLHQPLHTGYPDDRGGNDINVGLLTKGNTINLHAAWDYGIIESQQIKLADCLKLYEDLRPDEIARIRVTNPMQWMRESRAQLDSVYSFKENYLDQPYLNMASAIIKKQILVAGMRLAAVLEDIAKKIE